MIYEITFTMEHPTGTLGELVHGGGGRPAGARGHHRRQRCSRKTTGTSVPDGHLSGEAETGAGGIGVKTGVGLSEENKGERACRKCREESSSSCLSGQV